MKASAYAAWIDRHRIAIVVAGLALAVAAGVVASRLTLEADLSYLLPPSARSVRDLRAIEQRARVEGTVMIAVQASDPVRRAEAARAIRERLVLPDGARLTFDDGVARRFGWEHRWLVADLADLTAARDAVREELAAARLRANPLYVDLDEHPAHADTHPLRDKLAAAERGAAAPHELVSDDGSTQLLLVRTSDPAGDLARDQALLDTIGDVLASVRHDVPGVEVGMAGDVVLTVAEHDAIVDGMLLALAATVILVLVALLLYYRSGIAVAALSWSLLVGTLITFAFAELSVGHLNLATAFLSSIVIGNGINFGIVLVARYLELRRAGVAHPEALATAIGGTLTGTLAAALTAAVAYGSLTVTAFRGFRDFGVIAGIGILPCWIAAYTVLPALLSVFERRLSRPDDRVVGGVLGLLAPRAPRMHVAALIATLAIAGGATWCYLAGDPFESNFRRLRSSSAAIDEEGRWMDIIDHGFGKGISGGFAIAVERRDQTAPLVARLRSLDRGRAESDRLFSRIETIDDYVPVDQPAKLAVLAELRDLLTDAAIDELEPRERDEARRLRPPADLSPVTAEDIPEELAWPYIEADGSRGRIILAMPGWGYDNWDAGDIVRFAHDARGLDLGPETKLGGSQFVFADMLELVGHDGPIATLVAGLGSILVVLAIVGRRRHGVITIVCGLAGTLGMLALASLIGLRVNFLDFVALPITIGIGIDYAVNLAARDRCEPTLSSAELLRRTGSAVVLCSLTTIIGYGSLLLSRNQGIRSFGTAAILGEATCLSAALLFAPALLRRKSARPGTDEQR